MTFPADNAADPHDLPEGQAPPSPEGSAPETDADAQEREIQRRLTQSGREAAEARRQATSAQQALAAQTQQIGQLQASIQLLAANLSERDRRDAAQRQAQMEAELASLPPADRLDRRISMLQNQFEQLRTAGAQRQPAQQAPSAPPPVQPSDQERADYMERRVREITAEAQTSFGVSVNLDDIPDGDWESEDTFYRSVMKQAAQASTGGNGMPAKKQAETPAQMRDRIRQEERERLGVNSPTAPRAAPASSRKKSADEAEVRAAAQSYDSKLGPKANVAKMKELRATMG